MKSLLYICIYFCCLILNSQNVPPKQAYPLGVRQIHSGHSLTDPLFGQPWPGQYVNLMTELRGEWAGDDIGKATIPGSPMFWRWDNEEGLEPSARHDIGDWELLVITEGIPIPSHWNDPEDRSQATEALSKYVNNAWENGNGGEGAATMLWTTWTNLDGAEGPWRETLDEYEDIWEELADYADANSPQGATPVYIIPGHRMMARLYDDIGEGIVPGIDTIGDFFSDNIHVNSLGSYAVAMIHYACIYNRTPVGLPINLMPDAPVGFEYPSPELAAYLQDMIWDVVTSYPRTGVRDMNNSIESGRTLRNNISVYPNPTDGIINIDISTKDSAVYYFTDLLGNRVLEGKGSRLDMTGLNQGLYILHINGEGKLVIKR